jgi:hypothetical protein
MFMICLHTKFQTSRSNVELVVALKSKDKYRFHTATIFFYILCEIVLLKVLSVQDPVLSGATLAQT